MAKFTVEVDHHGTDWDIRFVRDGKILRQKSTSSESEANEIVEKLQDLADEFSDQD